jgi:two-component system chemotaxis response regulator CheY
MSKRIITVDDAQTIRRLVGYTLRGVGHNVIEAQDGVEALQVLEKQDVDLVITDVNMPNMDGLELVRRLRALQKFRSTPILLLTTESDPEKKKQGKEAGATGWITKPFQPDQLVAAVAKVTGS